MNGRSFDNWTRKRALRVSRRDALRLTAAGAASATLAARSLETLAETTCTMTMHAETAGGPSAPASYTGILQFVVGADGALSQASFTPGGGSAAPASGQLVGRAFDLSITLSANQTLALSGTAVRSESDCPSDLAGILSGPQPGDLGAWQAAGGSSPAAPPPASGQSNSGTSGSTDSAESSSDSSANCLELQSPCNASAECCSGWCTDNECRTCADTVCGEDCAVLSDNLAHCGACFNACNVDTETCVDGVCTAGGADGGNACLPDGAACSNDADCCSEHGCHFNLCGCASLGESCDESILYFCCEGTPVVCFGACCIINGFPCSADADCCEYIQGSGFCTNGICTRTT
jgi:hypothetical protein